MKKTTILCYGDSNTFGQNPDGGRYSYSERWPTILAESLGIEFYVLEEGLSGRTINHDDQNPNKPCKNGWTLFRPMLASHRPDYTIVLLGTNDTKIFYDENPVAIAQNLNKYIAACKEFSSKLILVSPAPATNGFINSQTGLSDGGEYDQESLEKMMTLVSEIEKIAKADGSPYIDASVYVKTGNDKIHWDKQSHQVFARYVQEFLLKEFNF